MATRRVIDHRLTVKAATAAIGGSLVYPSKMPGTSYGLDVLLAIAATASLPRT